MAWPSGSKAGTTNVDQSSDKIRLARPDIKQNIDNVNAIIDTFDIGTPSDGDTLLYNSSTSKFEATAGNVASYTVVLRFDTDISFPASGQYGGGFTLVGSNATGITVNQDSAGESQVIFPAGTYQINTVDDLMSGVFGGFTDRISMTTTWRNETDNSTVWEGTTASTGTYFNQYSIGTVVTLASDTTVNLLISATRGTGGSEPHPDVIITRLA